MDKRMTDAAGLIFYCADTPNGQKVSIFLQEAGLSYEQVNLNLAKGDQRDPAYLKINPNGKIPAIVDRAAGWAVFESGAILSYLSSKTGCLEPRTEAGNLAVQQWLHFQVGGIGPMLGQLWWFLHASKTQNAEAIHRYRSEALRLYGVVEARLSESQFIASPDYSIADIAAFAWLRTHGELRLDISAFPRVRRWLEVLSEREAVQRGLIAARPSVGEVTKPSDSVPR
jgi:GST-like protein